MYGLLADALVCFHLLYCGYVVLGQVAIVVAAPFKWHWARNPWFRYTHLLAIAVVVFEVGMGWRCPLTTWEEQLRALAGQDINSGDSFLGRLAHSTLFFDAPPIFFNTLHVATGVVVAQGFLMYPPRWFWQRREQPQLAAA
jgi:Protein of Unknown function (DUF2784)